MPRKNEDKKPAEKKTEKKVEKKETENTAKKVFEWQNQPPKKKD